MLGVGFLLIVGTGLFVASEFALVNLDRAELEARRDRGETRLKLTIDALKITSTHLSSAQLGITLTTLLTGYTMEPAMSKLLAGPLQSWGIPEGAVPVVATVTSVVVATLLSMIIGELVPKNFALALPRQTAKVVMPFQVLFTLVFKPAVVFLNNSANAILRAIGIEPKEELSGARSAEELTSLLRRSASAGSLDSGTATLLTRTLAFSAKTAVDVMTPRPRMVTVERSTSVEDVLRLARKSGFSRFPVIDQSVDDIYGIVHIKQALSVPREKRAEVPAAAIATEDVLRVPETLGLDALLEDLRGTGYQMAIVVDEYGGTAGITTLEDLVEEIVGELLDEHDRTTGQGIIRQADNLIFSGMLRPDELLDRVGITVPEGAEYETVAGFMLSVLGDIPQAGDRVSLPDGELVVERMDSRRIDRIRFIPAPETLQGVDGV